MAAYILKTKNKLPKKEEKKQLVYLRSPLFSFAMALVRDDDEFTLGLGLNGKSENALNTTQKVAIVYNFNKHKVVFFNR